jgi:hypothetical protein
VVLALDATIDVITLVDILVGSNPEPSALNLKLETLNPESCTLNTSHLRNPKSST